MDLLRKLYLLTAENVKQAREGRDLRECDAQKNDFKVNDLVLVRDVTSGAFAPTYSPNYRIVAIHGPNRIVVRDEKGNETVRQASHLKVCDLKAKTALMIPDENEYSNFGRSTKLLLHPKDVPDLQFSSKTEERGEVPPEAEISVVKVILKQERVKVTDVVEKSGEISPQLQRVVKTPVIKSSNEYIVDYTGDLKKCGEIPTEAAMKEESDKLYEKNKHGSKTQ